MVKFPAELVVKVRVASRLYGTGRMHEKEKHCFCLASAELKREAIKRYYNCLVDVQNKTAQQAFMSTCEFYSQVTPEIPEWRGPKEVAMILNPSLRVLLNGKEK